MYKYKVGFFFGMWMSIVLVTFVEKTTLFPLICLWAYVKNQLIKFVAYTSRPLLLMLISYRLFLKFYNTSDIQVVLAFIPVFFFFLFRVVLGIIHPLHFHNFRINFWISTYNLLGILIWVILNLQNNLGIIHILLSLLTKNNIFIH